MKKRIYDKQKGIYYELQGDYYLPCLKLPEQPKVEIGVWGCGSPVETSAQQKHRSSRQARLKMQANLVLSPKDVI